MPARKATVREMLIQFLRAERPELVALVEVGYDDIYILVDEPGEQRSGIDQGLPDVSDISEGAMTVAGLTFFFHELVIEAEDAEVNAGLYAHLKLISEQLSIEGYLPPEVAIRACDMLAARMRIPHIP